MATAKSKEIEKAEAAEIVQELPVVRDLSVAARQEKLGTVTNLSELQSVFNSRIIEWEEIEPSFDIVDQATFEGIPLVIGTFRFNLSKKFFTEKEGVGTVPVEFVSMLCAGYDPDEEKFITPWVVVNDGGQGIHGQLSRYADRFGGDTALCPPIKLSKGFRKSEYMYESTDDKGKKSVTEATTWYLG